MAGSYLHRLLARQGVAADLYDRPAATACGIHPCAWGSSRGFHRLVAAADLDPEDYVLERPDHLFLDEVRVPAELFTFDKPRLLADLRGGARVRRRPLEPGRYRRVIDATGVSRAYLPPAGDDLVLACVQRRVASPRPLGNRVRLGGVGYAWCFPLQDGEHHLGCGSLRADPLAALESTGWLRAAGGRLRCQCRARIRLAGPQAMRPFVAGRGRPRLWGVGEAIGCVAPLAGDGVVPGMRSVELLLEHWDHPEAYTRAVLAEFAWMAPERRVVDKLRQGRRLGLRDAKVLKDNSRRMGMRVGLREAALLLARLW
jgi:flavin-dependent dehydrogenase